MKTQEIKRNKSFTGEANNLMEDLIIVGNMATKRKTVGNFMGNPTLSRQEEKDLWVKAKGKFDFSKVKCCNCNQLGDFAKDGPFPDKRIKSEEDQYPPNAFTMMCMDEEKDNAKTVEEKESEEREEQPEEGEQRDVQEGAQVHMTFKEMLSRYEEQTVYAHDSIKIKFERWDVTMRHAAHHMEPNVDCDKEPPRTSREDKEMKNK